MRVGSTSHTTVVNMTVVLAVCPSALELTKAARRGLLYQRWLSPVFKLPLGDGIDGQIDIPKV